jgi:transcriptional regulator with XRE-family HTH domain
MTYATKHVAATLKAAREAKGLTQRDLAKLAGVPQSYISRIESGSIDLRLSSLVEVARALDLELTLVPRRSMPAVQSIVRGNRTSEFPADNFCTAKELRRLQVSLSHLTRANPTVKEIAQLQRQVRDLQHFRLAASDLDALRKVSKTIQAVKAGSPNLDAIRHALSELQSIRNSVAHAMPTGNVAKPAYSLDENDHE